MTIAVETITVGEAQEQGWNTFLSELKPWELHRLMKDELELHDKYMSGELSIMDVFALISDEEKAPATA